MAKTTLPRTDNSIASLRDHLHRERRQIRAAHRRASKQVHIAVATENNCGMAIDLIDRLLKRLNGA